MLLAVEAVPESQVVIEAAARLAARSRAEVLVLSLRELEFTRGVVWDRRPLGEIAELVSGAIYELLRVGVRARGLIGIAVSGRVAEEIVYTAQVHGADQIVIGSSGRGRVGRLVFGSVAPRVVRLAGVPVVAVPTKSSRGASVQPAPPRTPRVTRTPRPR